MNSCLYDCEVTHARSTPKNHRFRYRYFTFCLDLDEIDQISAQHRFFGLGVGKLFRFQARDFFFGSQTQKRPAMKNAIIDYVRSQGVEVPIHRVELVAHMKTFGYVFNPAAFYFCYDAADVPVCAILEVTNTYRERKVYFLGPESFVAGTFHSSQSKLFYVSPFVKLEATFDMILAPPSTRLRLQIDSKQNGILQVHALLAGSKVSLSDPALLWRFLTHPLVTVSVMAKIHYQALSLFLKGVPYLKKTTRGSWHQKTVLGLLSRMDQGRLTVTLPKGQALIFGAQDFEENPTIQASIQINSPDFFKRCMLYGDIGFGEAYTDGLWETENLTQVIEWMILNTKNNPAISGSKVSTAIFGVLKGINRFRHLGRDNSLAGSQRNISEHYDLSNDLFATFLDRGMTYSSGDFSSGAQSLEEAQVAKFDRLAQAIQVERSDHVLEIGGGWGGLAIHLASKYGCKVTTLTVSKEQFRFMQERVSASGLTDKIEILYQDYRKTTGQYDKIISVEMLEAVGHKHLPTFFEVADRVLKPTGLMGVQVITSADSRYELLKNGVDWVQKHIFPGSLLPSIGALTDAARATSSLQMRSLLDLGPSYAKTLAEWRTRFNSNLEQIKGFGFDGRFIRAWNYYFSYCEAAFATRHISVVQIVYTRPNNSEIRG